jgi:hypothetical protein
LNTQDTRRRQTIQKHRQHCTHKTQDEDKQSRDIGNIGHTKHRTKTNNPETSAALDTQDTGRRHTKRKNTTLTERTKMMNKQKNGGEPKCWRRLSSSCFL